MRSLHVISGWCLALVMAASCQEYAPSPPEIEDVHPFRHFVNDTDREAFIRGSNFFGTVRVPIDSDDPPVLDLEFRVWVAGQELPEGSVEYVDTGNIRMILPDGLGIGLHSVELTTPPGLTTRKNEALEVFDGSIFIEDDDEGEGSEVGDLIMSVDDDLRLYCVTRRTDGTYVRNERCSWSLTERIGELDPAVGEATEFSPFTTGITRVSASHPTLGNDLTGTIRVRCQNDDECADPCRSTNHCDEGDCIQGPVDKDDDNDQHLDADCPGGDDCDDDDPGRNPSESEICDDLDNDCDPQTPDGADEPGFGESCDGPDSDLCLEGQLDCDPDGPTLVCTDDTDDDRELCDGEDNDCDPDTPDGQDEDGLGEPCDGDDSDFCQEGQTICDGSVVCSDNSDDSLELCDGRDNDCDGDSDEEGALFCTEYFLDADQDSFGDPVDSRCLCEPEGEHTAITGDDCDDDDPDVHPEAHEGVVVDLQCNDGVDNDCDGLTDSEDPCCGAWWWDNAWPKRRQLTFENDAQTENLHDIPVMVKLDQTLIDYDDSGANGESLRFVDADCTTLLDHEIEAWTYGGESLVWVRVPRIAQTGYPDHIWMYYSNPGAPDGQNATGVWASGYEAVYHLHGSCDDSTGRGIHGSCQGTTNGPGNSAGGQVFDGAGAHVYLGTDLDLLRGVPAATISAWFRASSMSEAYLIALSVADTQDTHYSRASVGIISPGEMVSYARAADDDPEQNILTDTTPLSTGSWHYATAAISYAYNRITLYLDGVEIDFASVDFSQPTTADTPTHNNSIGCQDDASDDFFSGTIDEVRVARTLRSAAWIAAQHLAATNALVLFGPEETH